jgi:hypothetical protein
MRLYYFVRIFLIFFCLCLLSASSTRTTHPPQRKMARHSTTSAIPTNAPQNKCPAQGTVRPASLPPLAAHGNHQNIVYFDDQVTNAGVDASLFASGSLKRYDATAHRHYDILNLAQAYIYDAVVSADGQWVLFVSDVGTFESIQARLQLVRIDGQDLQTLYCSTPGQGIGQGVGSVQWSPDQRHVLFSANVGNLQRIFLLTLATGQMQQAIVANSITSAYAPDLWLDATHIYLSTGPAGSNTYYLLDINKGANQPLSELQRVTAQGIALSYTSGQFFTSRYMLLQNDTCVASTGPSSLRVGLPTGGEQKTIYSDQHLAVIAIQAISKARLLLDLQNGTCNAMANVDFSSNGLWLINTDGTDLHRLTSPDASAGGTLVQLSQDFWSDISRDGTMYVWQTARVLSQSPDAPTYELSYGSLSGGGLTPFASAAHGEQLALVGWTAM